LHSPAGSEQFVERIKAELGPRALGGRIHEMSGGYALRESEKSYNARFDPKKGNIGHENTSSWAALP